MTTQEKVSNRFRQLQKVNFGLGVTDRASNIRAARQAATEFNPGAVNQFDEEMRIRRAQQIEDESNRTNLELAKEKLRRLKAQGTGE